MDTHLVQLLYYAKTIDDLREENRQLKKNSEARCESLKNYYTETNRLAQENLELKKKNLESIKRINDQTLEIKKLEDENFELTKSNIHKDSSFWKQREELKEENRVLRQVLSDIATNLGNGSTVSVEASLSFIKELSHEVKLVCDRLRKDLAREQRTCNSLREELQNPPADVQEKVLDMLGVNKRLLELSEQYRELRDESKKVIERFDNTIYTALVRDLKNFLEKTNGTV